MFEQLKQDYFKQQCYQSTNSVINLLRFSPRTEVPHSSLSPTHSIPDSIDLLGIHNYTTLTSSTPRNHVSAFTEVYIQKSCKLTSLYVLVQLLWSCNSYLTILFKNEGKLILTIILIKNTVGRNFITTPMLSLNDACSACSRCVKVSSHSLVYLFLHIKSITFFSC